MGNCNCLSKDRGDEAEYLGEEFQKFSNEDPDYIDQDRPLLRGAPKNIPSIEEISKIKEKIHEKIIENSKETEITIEEITEEQFSDLLKKNQNIARILNNNQDEINTFIYEGDEKIYNVPPLKFSNKKTNENEYYKGTYDENGNICGKGIIITKENNVY